MCTSDLPDASSNQQSHVKVTVTIDAASVTSAVVMYQPSVPSF